MEAYYLSQEKLIHLSNNKGSAWLGEVSRWLPISKHAWKKLPCTEGYSPP
jgi:hypothetical protein